MFAGILNGLQSEQGSIDSNPLGFYHRNFGQKTYEMRLLEEDSLRRRRIMPLLADEFVWLVEGKIE